MTELFFKEMKSPVGRLKLVVTDEALVAILWEKERAGRVRLNSLREKARHPLLIETEKQLREYFAGARKTFKLPVAPWGGTEFQSKVWQALREIPFGETRSYADIAQRIGHPKAARAVGMANGRNPLSIVIPCHRVIGRSGKLTGFAGGLEHKGCLLKLEQS